MTLYRVLIERSEVHEAFVEIVADDPSQAADEAVERADAGLANWVRVHRETRREVSECPK